MENDLSQIENHTAQAVIALAFQDVAPFQYEDNGSNTNFTLKFTTEGKSTSFSLKIMARKFPSKPDDTSYSVVAEEFYVDLPGTKSKL